MLLNILYYDQAADAKNNNKTSGSLALGPLYITPEQVCLIYFNVFWLSSIIV